MRISNAMLVVFAIASASPAAAEWTTHTPDSSTTIIEGVSEEGSARMQITCKRAGLELRFVFANGPNPPYIRYETGDKRWKLEQNRVPGKPGVTLTKPHSYGVLIDIMGADRLRVQSFHMNTPVESVEGNFDIKSLRELVDKRGDTCLFRSPPPKA